MKKEHDLTWQSFNGILVVGISSKPSHWSVLCSCGRGRSPMSLDFLKSMN